MGTLALGFSQRKLLAERGATHNWQRIVVLLILGYEGLGALIGGSFLVVSPDGSLMDMPVDILHGTFPDFLIPGIILLAMGIFSIVAFVSTLRRTPNDLLLAGIAIAGWLIWYWIEISILLEVHWLHAMWGLPVIPAVVAALSLATERNISLRNGALICGIAASLLYIVANILVPGQWAAYDSVTQTVSELSAIDAPTRFFWIALSAPYTPLMIAFAWGVWRSAGSNPKLRIAGCLLMAYGALGILWFFAPMHLRETIAAGGGTISDTMHLVLAGVTQTIFLLSLGLTATSLGKQFRNFSIATVVLMVVFGFLTFLEAPGIDTGAPTPMIGVWERINIGLFLVWVIVLAIKLLKTKEN